jgi:hypothetical protein
MTKMLYALMDSTDHLMENGTPQKLYGLVEITASPGVRTYSGSQPDLVVISDSKALI